VEKVLLAKLLAKLLLVQLPLVLPVLPHIRQLNNFVETQFGCDDEQHRYKPLGL
jgi:hypothetical protein